MTEKYIPAEQLNRDGELKEQINYKPKFAFVIGLVIGILLCLSMKWTLIILGVFFLVLAGLVAFYLKDYKVIDIYDSFLIVYDLDDTFARRIEFDEISEWTGKHGSSGADAIMLKLNDGETIYKDTFLISKAYRCLNKLLPEKESQSIKDAENKKTKLKFDIPFLKKKDK